VRWTGHAARMVEIHYFSSKTGIEETSWKT